MPYREEIDALRERLESAEEERDVALAELDRTRALLRATVSYITGEPDAGARWCSFRGGEPIEVTFENASTRRVELVLVNADGVERAVGTIVAGGRSAQPTFVGHLFRLYEARTRELLLHVFVRAGGTTITFEESRR